MRILQVNDRAASRKGKRRDVCNFVDLEPTVNIGWVTSSDSIRCSHHRDYVDKDDAHVLTHDIYLKGMCTRQSSEIESSSPHSSYNSPRRNNHSR